MFLALSLYEVELLKLKFMFKLFIGAWLMAILFFIKIILPFSWSFFLSFQTSLTTLQQTPFIFEAKIEEYYQFFISSYYTSLFSCQFLIFLISFLTGFTKKFKKIKKFRKFFYLTFVVFSTLITPPDIISQLLISSVLIVIYEFLIFMKCLRLKW